MQNTKRNKTYYSKTLKKEANNRNKHFTINKQTQKKTIGV